MAIGGGAGHVSRQGSSKHCHLGLLMYPASSPAASHLAATRVLDRALEIDSLCWQLQLTWNQARGTRSAEDSQDSVSCIFVTPSIICY